MADNPRQIGGLSNKRGNRYEDLFAVFNLISFTPRFIIDGQLMRLREQTGLPVDDLWIEEPGRDRFFQLKADKAITWGEANGKLANEFRRQKALCEARVEQSSERQFALTVVVADEGRHASLCNGLPEDLRDCTDVFLFPAYARPSDMALPGGLLDEALGEICASRNAGVSDRQHLLLGYHAAWVDHQPDAEGFCTLTGVLTTVRALGAGKLRHHWTDRPTDWAKAEAVLNGIAGLCWHVDRGYFEWAYPPTDSGISPEECESLGFLRFIDRLIQDRPRSFQELERILP